MDNGKKEREVFQLIRTFVSTLCYHLLNVANMKKMLPFVFDSNYYHKGHISMTLLVLPTHAKNLQLCINDSLFYTVELNRRAK